LPGVVRFALNSAASDEIVEPSGEELTAPEVDVMDCSICDTTREWARMRLSLIRVGREKRENLGLISVSGSRQGY
jgi:hypothetical protein